MSAVETMVTRESLARDILLKLLRVDQARLRKQMADEPDGTYEDCALWYENKDLVETAVKLADALLAELAKGREA